MNGSGGSSGGSSSPRKAQSSPPPSRTRTPVHLHPRGEQRRAFAFRGHFDHAALFVHLPAMIDAAQRAALDPRPRISEARRCGQCSSIKRQRAVPGAERHRDRDPAAAPAAAASPGTQSDPLRANGIQKLSRSIRAIGALRRSRGSAAGFRPASFERLPALLAIAAVPECQVNCLGQDKAPLNAHGQLPRYGHFPLRLRFTLAQNRDRESRKTSRER